MNSAHTFNSFQAIAIALFSIFLTGESQAIASRPNVLLIAVDDLNDWVG